MVTPLPQSAARVLTTDESALRYAEGELSLPETLAARPLTALFDAAFDVYRRHWASIASIVAVGFVPLQIALHALVNLLLRPWSARIDNIADTSDQLMQALLVALGYLFAGYPQYGVPGILSLLVLLLVSGAVSVAVADALHGEPIRLGRAYARLSRVLFRLAGVWLAAFMGSLLLVAVVGYALAFVLGLFAVLFASAVPEVVGYVLVILIVVCPYAALAAFLARVFLLTTPLIVLEGRTAAEIPTRNGQLLRQAKFWKVWLATMGLPIVVLGLQYLVFAGVNMTVGVVMMNIGAESPATAFVRENLLATLIYFCFQPYWMIFLTLLYFDGRVRRDGYDVYRMAQALERAETPGVTP
jgi:phage-related holin